MNNNIKETSLVSTKEVFGKEFNIYGTIEEPLFLARDVAEFIDYAYKDKNKDHRDISKMLKSVDEEEKIKKKIQGNNSPLFKNLDNTRSNMEYWFLTEDGLYEVLFISRKPIAKTFKKEVKAILKELRLRGVVITENATQDNIDFASKYSSRRIRNTFNETTDLWKEWEQFKELLKSQKLTGKEKLTLYDIVYNTIENKYNGDTTGLRGSQVIAMRELTEVIGKDIRELSNRINGGYKSALTKKNKLLIKERDEAYAYINKLMPDIEEYNYLNLHGFTVNKQYEPDVTEYGIIRTNIEGQPKLRKTEAYKIWLENFKREMDQLDLDINFENGVDIYLYFDHMEKFDCHNFHKSFFDALSAYYGVDDKIFHLKCCETNNIVDSYKEGIIYFCIREREE